jgi:outer membrane cobalamin receptor
MVVDPSGAPLPRARIEVRDARGGIVATALTNSRGEYALQLPPGKYNLSAAMAGFVPIADRIVEVPLDASPIRLTLEIPSPRELVVVTATRTETPMSQIGNSATVLSGEELALRGASSVADALRALAGVTLVQSGGSGSMTSIFMRGGESDYTKILVDGIPMNEPGGSYNLAYLSTSGIDRIEVVRGPQSALFGSDAISGVIQVFTKRGRSEGLSPRPSVMIEGGTYATLRYGGGLEGSNDRMDYAVSFFRTDTDNDVANGSFNETTFAGNLGLQLSRKAELRAVFRSEAGRSGVPGPWAFERPDPDAYYRRRDVSGSLTLTHFQTPAWTHRVSYTVNDSYQLSANPLDSGSYTPQYQGRVAPFPFSDWVYESLNQTRRQKANYQSDLVMPSGHLLTVGADYEHESGVVGDPALNPASVTRDNYGVYLQDQWSLKNRFFAAAGVRLDHNESFGFYASPRVSLALLVRQPGAASAWGTTKIKANFGLGIKEPTLLESYSTSIYYQGNPDLRPEKTVGFDAGIEQQFHSGRGTLELTYFQNQFRDQIGFSITDYSTFAGSFFNIGKSRARGLEVSLRREMGWNLEMGGSYTFLDSEVLEASITSDPAFAKGQELFRRPRHSGSLDLRWRPGRLTLGANALLVGSRVDSDFSGLNITRNEGYSLLNLMVNFRLIGGTSLFAAVNNVTDEWYMEALGYPALGRHFRAGLLAGF